MNGLIKCGVINPQIQSGCFQLKSAFFHSTPVLQRGRRNCWNSRYNSYNKGRSRRNSSRQHILRNINEYAEYLIQNWQSGFDHHEEPSNRGPSWFRQPPKGGKNWTNNQRYQSRRRREFTFCEDDDNDMDDAFFRSAFGDRFFFWSFIHEDYPNWRTSSRHSNRHRTSWKQRQQSEDEYEYDYTSDSESLKLNLVSERVALGLSASGPLKIEDVKNAYRACALKWHPDRHQGSSKPSAEEKFKLCTAAYQSLCERLAVN